MKPIERYLVIYSFFVTLTFAASVYIVVRPRPLLKIDRLQAHRIDLIEPDGTERLILSDRANYPGSFFHGAEVQRPDRNDSAGMLFIDDEGNEDGGLIFGGKLVKGHPVTFGHLSFDAYQQDQTVSLESTFEDGQRHAAVVLKDMPDTPITPAMIDDVERVKAIPDGPAQEAAWKAVRARYEFGRNRALLARNPDGSVGLTLNDVQGHPRIKLVVLPSGEPEMDMLDADGKVLRAISAR
jgi:hypothetical protein